MRPSRSIKITFTFQLDKKDRCNDAIKQDNHKNRMNPRFRSVASGKKGMPSRLQGIEFSPHDLILQKKTWKEAGCPHLGCIHQACSDGLRATRLQNSIFIVLLCQPCRNEWALTFPRDRPYGPEALEVSSNKKAGLCAA